MQQISVRAFGFNKTTQTLSAFESDIRHQINFALLLTYETFEIVGVRETRRYQFVETQYEQSGFEIGDVEAWHFRPVDGYGRGVDGPRLVVFND